MTPRGGDGIRQRVLQATAWIGATVALGSFCTYRYLQAGSWLPPVPATIDDWEATDAPIPPDTLAILGNPRATGLRYRSPFNDIVDFSQVTAGMFENYHDPTVCVGGGDFQMTARRIVTLGSGPDAGVARAMVFRHRKENDVRIIMYYWQQNSDGTTDYEARMGNFRDILARFKTGFSSVVLGRRTLLIRIHAFFKESQDPDGLHTQTQVHAISEAIYAHLRREGKRA